MNARNVGGLVRARCSAGYTDGRMDPLLVSTIVRGSPPPARDYIMYGETMCVTRAFQRYRTTIVQLLFPAASAVVISFSCRVSHPRGRCYFLCLILFARCIAAGRAGGRY